MTVPMDNSLDLSSRERVKGLYNKNVELDSRRRRSAQARIPSDPSTWQQMRENFEAIILEDHAFSELHEIEYSLWQLHYKRIEELRGHLSAALASASTASQSGKGSVRPERVAKIRSQFKAFLSEATGFYHDLMLKIRAKYGLPLDYFSDDQENQIVQSKVGNKSTEMKKGLISCHRCLIYLGDLARYKGLYGEGDSKIRDFAAASSFYIQASSLWPSSGNPHHQLAILASYSGDELVAIYQYFRSLAVDSPFSTARENLIIAFEKNRQSYTQLIGDAKAAPARTAGFKGRGKGEARAHSKDQKTEASSMKEKASSIPEILKAFSIRFVRLNGILFTRTSLETFGEVFAVAKGDFLKLLSSGPEEVFNFGRSATESGLMIVRLIAILIFTVHNANRETENQSYAEILQRSVLLQNAFTALFDFMGHILERCLQLRDPSGSYLLPGVLVFVEWLACRPDVAAGSEVEEKQADARFFFWNNCITLLNKLLLSGFLSTNEDEDETCFFNMSRYDEGETGNRLALWEDFELRGFLPLAPAQLILDFSRKHSLGTDGGIKEKNARIERIIAAGKAFVNVIQVGKQGIYFDAKLKKFAIGVEPQMSDDDLLANSLEVPKIEHSGEMKMNLVGMQPMTQLYVEGEEEDEVIVFKPPVTDKNANALATEMTYHEVLAPFNDISKGEMESFVKSVTVPPDTNLLQNAFDTSFRPPSSLTNILPQQHLQQIQPSSSKWLVEHQAFIANGLNNLSFVETGLAFKPELQENLGILQPAVPSLPFPQSLNFNAGIIYSGQVPGVSSNFDTVMSSGASFGSVPAKTSSALPASSKRSPVCRPVRHLGPPPGFSTVPPKLVDDPLSGATVKNEHLLMDDYSWLDGYQLPSSTQGSVFSNSTNQSAQTLNHATKSNNFIGNVSFPFPGKQVSGMQIQVEHQKNWQDYQFSANQKLFQDQYQQLQKGNQHSIPLPEQYQGQSLWEGSFFV